jgi:hypothetical protein
MTKDKKLIDFFKINNVLYPVQFFTKDIFKLEHKLAWYEKLTKEQELEETLTGR